MTHRQPAPDAPDRKRQSGEAMNVWFYQWLRAILLVVILGVPAFAWVQYRQAQSLARLTSQNLSGIEWDAFKLELRSLHLRNALREAVAQPDAPPLLAKVSKEYNLFAAQALMMKERSTAQEMDDQPGFKTAMSQAQSFMKQAAPTLEKVPGPSDGQALQALLLQTDQLRAQIYPFVVEAHDLRALRTNQLIEQVKRANFYFAFLSAFLVALGAGWGLSAMRNLRLAARRNHELNILFEESSFRASHDYLTGLASRSLLYDQLKHALASSKRSGQCGAVLMLDLDNFKPVNDKYGHDVGDKLLVEAALRMQNCVRDVDTVARVGGDEFMVLLGQMDGSSEAAGEVASSIGKNLLDALSVPYALTLAGSKAGAGVVSHCCTASIGVAIFCKDQFSADDIISCADAAMYRAKRGGGSRVELAA